MSNPFRVKGAMQAGLIKTGPGATLTPSVQRAEGESAPGEKLTGQVQGQPASDLEERVSRAVEKHPAVRTFWFNPRLVGGQILPPNLSLSYAIYAPILFAVQVDPVFPGDSGDERAQARVNDDLLFEHLRTIGAGAQPVIRLSRLELATQHGADSALMGLL